MAAIGEIRKHSTLLVSIIALSIVGFLLMDATNSQFGVLKSHKDSVGEINGEKININEFNAANDKNTKDMEAQMPKGTNLNDEQRNYIRQKTWDDMIAGSISKNLESQTGLAVSDDEMLELTTGNFTGGTQNVHPYIKQNFGGEQFNPMYVKNFLSGIDVDDKGQEPGYKRRVWNNLYKQIEEGQFKQKYTNLITKSMGAPTWMANSLYVDGNKTADIKYVNFPYSEINDADVKITDAELGAYLNDHAARFKQDEETRKIQYVAFDIAASSMDSAQILKSLTDRMEEFRNGKTKSEDSLFVKLYSEVPFNDDFKTSQDLASSPKSDSLARFPVGTVMGPYVENGMFTIAKVANKKMLSDSVKVREITFSFNKVQNEQQQKERFKFVDSIFRAIDSFGADFGALATAYSDDAAGKANGGQVGWKKFKKGGTEEEEFVSKLLFFQAKPGKTYRLVSPSENAVKLVQVIEEKPSHTGVQIAYFSKAIVPSGETEKNIYADAVKFATDYSTEDKFKKAGEKFPVKTVQEVHKNDFQLMGLNGARDIVRWVFEAKKGDISPVKSADKKHAIIYVESIRAKGTPDLDAVKDQVKVFALKDKKFDLLAKKIADMKAGDIDLLASKAGKTATVAEKVIFANPNLGAGGYEPNVAAAAMNAPLNKVSAPIKGNQGVFVIQKVAGVEPPKAVDLAMPLNQLKQMASQKAGRGAFEALKKSIPVEDNRTTFF